MFVRCKRDERFGVRETECPRAANEMRRYSGGVGFKLCEWSNRQDDNSRSVRKSFDARESSEQ